MRSEDVPLRMSFPDWGLVRQHPSWNRDYKPYAWPVWPYKGLHKSIETHYLYRQAFDIGKGNYANLGVYHGHSTNALAHGAAIHGGHVFGVDIFKPTLSTKIVVGKKKLDEEFIKNGLGNFVTLLEGSTHDCARRLSDHRFKFIFIDADHKYEAVLDDIQQWKPLLEPDGILSFHDTFMKSVIAAIDEELDDSWELIDHVYTIKSYRKKGT